MNLVKADIIVNKIISGITRFKVKDFFGNCFRLIIKSPSRYHRFVSGEVYNEIYQECLDIGMFTESQLSLFLEENGIWNQDDEKRLKTLKDDIEELKVFMYGCYFDSIKLEHSRKILRLAQNDLFKLYERKTSYNHMTAEGFADIEKNKFLIGVSLFDYNNEPFVDEDSYWKMPAFILEQALVSYRNGKPSESELRWISRNEPWRSYWLSRKAESSLFGIPSVDMSEDQRSLVIWSSLYDNIYENPEQPPPEVINDDDVLDGWFTVQRRQREKEMNTKAVNGVITNEKINNSEEIFIVPESEEGMRRISSLNGVEAQVIKASRFNAIDKKGSIKEYDLPDVQREIKKKQAEMFRDKLKSN
jgi:hypothetical protein